MKGYKIFDGDWKCNGVQFQLGETTVGAGFCFYPQAIDCLQRGQLKSGQHYAEIEAGDIAWLINSYTTDRLHVVRELSQEEFATLCSGTVSWDDGEKVATYTYVRGEKHGPYTEWYGDAIYRYDGNYTHGKEHGLHTWYQNGIKTSECNFEHGNRHGQYTVWSSNTKIIEYNYVNGETHGPYTEWYENGSKREGGYYNSGQLHGTRTLWYENGQKKEEHNYENDVLHGPHTLWYENGQKKDERNYVNGELHGPRAEWYPDGTKSSVCNYHSRQLHGTYTRWRPDGTKCDKRFYEHGRLL